MKPNGLDPTAEPAGAATVIARRLPLLLASTSPRRRQLLEQAGFAFLVAAPRESAECGLCSGESPPQMVARLAFQKAADLRPRYPDHLILACDTVAEWGGQALGKPRDVDHARQILQTLSGREHRVYSGLCVWPPGSPPAVRVAKSVLRMERLSEEQLANYLAGGEWEGKAGAFGYQDGLDWVHLLSGSESNVVGLPLELLAEMLARLPGEKST